MSFKRHFLVYGAVLPNSLGSCGVFRKVTGQETQRTGSRCDLRRRKYILEETID